MSAFYLRSRAPRCSTSVAISSASASAAAATSGDRPSPNDVSAVSTAKEQQRRGQRVEGFAERHRVAEIHAV